MSQKKVTENYRHPLTLAGNGLRYFKHHSKDQHVVVHEMHAGEDVAPDVFRFATVEEARQMWRQLRQRLAASGYERVR